MSLSVHVSVSDALTFLVIAILPKVEEAFWLFCYIPYSSLTTSARIKASCGKEEVILSPNGSFSVKSLDRRNEKAISVVD